MFHFYKSFRWWNGKVESPFRRASLKMDNMCQARFYSGRQSWWAPTDAAIGMQQGQGAGTADSQPIARSLVGSHSWCGTVTVTSAHGCSQCGGRNTLTREGTSLQAAFSRNRLENRNDFYLKSILLYQLAHLQVRSRLHFCFLVTSAQWF